MVGAQTAENDLVQQANIGLMKAADRFNPDRGFRFSTYAVWWVRAGIQDYKLTNMPILRRPSSTDFRKAMASLARPDETMCTDPRIAKADVDGRVAATLGVSIKRLAELCRQISSAGISLNLPELGEGGDKRMARLADPADTENVNKMHMLDIEKLRGALVEAIGALPDEEREIIMAPQIKDPPATLEVLGNRSGVSKERVRQLRERGFERLRASMDQSNLALECFV